MSHRSQACQVIDHDFPQEMWCEVAYWLAFTGATCDILTCISENVLCLVDVLNGFLAVPQVCCEYNIEIGNID